MESQEVVDFVSERLDKGLSLKAIAEAVNSPLAATGMEVERVVVVQMCDHCLAPDASGDGTGCDNMTVIICRLNHGLANGALRAANGD